MNTVSAAIFPFYFYFIFFVSFASFSLSRSALSLSLSRHFFLVWLVYISIRRSRFCRRSFYIHILYCDVKAFPFLWAKSKVRVVRYVILCSATAVAFCFDILIFMLQCYNISVCILSLFRVISRLPLCVSPLPAFVSHWGPFVCNVPYHACLWRM